MIVSQAIELANSFFIPEFLLADGLDAVEGERAQTEEAIRTLRDAWLAEPAGQESFSFDLVRELADRNRQLCDLVEASDDPAAQQLAQRRREASGLNLARGLSVEDLVAGVAALQRRKPGRLIRMVAGDPDNLAVAYVDAPVKGTVLGIDIETTGRHPDRGYIINVGWELMELSPSAKPHDAEAVYCGLPAVWEGRAIPLEEIHHITPDMLAGKTPLREDKALQRRLLALLTKHPYLAHNAAFEDSWLMLHLDGYAEARKAGKIIPIDTRDICRRVDKDAVGIPREQHPNTLENWARRRGTLSADEAERHLGLDDTDLMLRTVQAEFTLRNMFAESARGADGTDDKATAAHENPTTSQPPKPRRTSKKKASEPKVDGDKRKAAVDALAASLAPMLASAAAQGPDFLASRVRSWVMDAVASLSPELAASVHVGDLDEQGFVATLAAADGAAQSETYQARLSMVDQTALAYALASFASDLAEAATCGTLPDRSSLLACFR